MGYSDRGTRNDGGGAGSNEAEILRRVEKSTPLKKVQFANGDLQVGDQKIHLDATVRFVIAVWAAIAYLLFCYCALLICKKTGNEPGISVVSPGRLGRGKAAGPLIRFLEAAGKPIGIQLSPDSFAGRIKDIRTGGRRRK